jgi:hypothetical protein
MPYKPPLTLFALLRKTLAPEVLCWQQKGQPSNLSHMQALQNRASQQKPQDHTADILYDILMQQKRTGISSVKVDVMRVLGLFIPFTSNDLAQWPDHAACSPAVYVVPGPRGHLELSPTSYSWVFSLMHNNHVHWQRSDIVSVTEMYSESE